MLNRYLSFLFLALFCSTVQSQTVRVNSIKVTGNKKTKWTIIERELTVHEGDTLPKSKLEKVLAETSQNLKNTLLFNFVTITPQYTDSSHVNINIDVLEAWYLWPNPLFEVVSRNLNEWWLTKDFNKINYGLYLSQDNFRGMAENVSIGFRGGYTQSYFASYTIPYLNKGRKAGLSLSYSYARFHEITYNTIGNKLQFYRSENFYNRKQQGAAIKFTYRAAIHQTHTIRLNYNFYEISDSAVKFNPDYFSHNSKSVSYFTLGYFYKLDYRSFKPYPLTGYYADLDLTQTGLGIISNDINSFYATVNLRKFWRLKGRLYYASGITHRESFNNKQFYYNQLGLGFDDFVRGYEYYVINGQSYTLFQSNIKFALLQDKVTHLRWIPTEKFNTIPHSFFLNLFLDGGYVRDLYFREINPMANKLQVGYGAGLDYVTYYSWVLRVEYSINKFGERGIFLHFNAPI